MKYHDEKAGKDFNYDSLKELGITKEELAEYKQKLIAKGINPFVAGEGYSLPPIYLTRINRHLYYTMMKNDKKGFYRQHNKKMSNKPTYEIKYTNEFLNQNFKVRLLKNGSKAVEIISSGRYKSRDIYTNGMCPDNTSGKLTHNKNYYDIRQLCYCLRTGSHFYDSIRSRTFPEKTDDSDNGWIFNFDDIVVQFPDGTEWKDYTPPVTKTENPSTVQTELDFIQSAPLIVEDTSSNNKDYTCSVIIAYDKEGSPIILCNARTQMEKNSLLSLFTNAKNELMGVSC